MTSEETEARDRLLFHLENQTGFWFALVVGDDVGPRARLREAAEAWCKEHGSAFVLHEPQPDELAALAIEFAREAGSGLHWIRADGPLGLIEQWDAAAAQLLLAMNERREAYRKRFDGGVVIEGRESLKRLLRDLAPDLFTIRAFIAEPGAGPKAHERAPSEWRLSVSVMNLMGVVPDPEHAVQQLDRLKGLAGVEAKEQWFAAPVALVSLLQFGRFEEAARWADEHVKEAEQRLLDGRQGESARFLVVILHLAQSVRADKGGQTDKALQHLSEACAVAESYVADRPDEAALEVALPGLHRLRGDLLSRMGDHDGADAAFEMCLRIVEDVLARNPSSMETRLEMVNTCRALSTRWRKKDDLVRAETSARKALGVVEKSVSEHPEDERWQIEFARASLDLGVILLRRGDLDAALAAASASVSVADRHVKRDASNRDWQDQLTAGCCMMCLLLFNKGDFDETHMPLQERALAVVVSNFERDPADTRAGWVAVALYTYRALILEAKRDTAGMHETAERAWVLARRLPVRTDENRNLRRRVASLRAKGAQKKK